MTFAHLFFMGSGYLIRLLLGRYFAPAVYGSFGIIISLLNILSTLSVSGVYKSMAKFIASAPKTTKKILKFSLKLEFLIALIFTFLFFFLAEPVARIIFKDASLVLPLKIISLILPFYIFRSVFLGLLLGLKEYFELSLINIFSAVVKVVLAIGVVLLGYRLIGILFVYLITAIASLLLGIWFVLKKEFRGQDSDFNKRTFLNWSLLLTALAFVTPFFRDLSLYLLKYLEVVPDKIGFYNAAMTLGSLPAVLSVGLAGAILPAVSATYTQKKFDYVKDQINDVLRYSFLFLLPMVIVLSLSAEKIMALVFSEIYREASLAFGILIFGFFFFALYNILNSVLIAIGKGKEILIYSAFLILVYLLLSAGLIPRYDINGAALASLIIFFLSFLIFLIIVSQNVGRIWLKPWLFKIPFFSLLTGLIFYFLLDLLRPQNLFLLLFLYFLAGVVYFLFLLFFKEITRRDFKLIVNIFFHDRFRIRK